MSKKVSYESVRAEEMKLSFDSAIEEFAKHKVQFGVFQMATLKLIDADKMYTNLAILLSDQCAYTIKVAMFRDNTSLEIQDRQEFGGSLFKQYYDVHYLLESIASVSTAPATDEAECLPGNKRDFPEIAIKEALINAIMHRDYAISESILIKIFTDRIEFISPGGLSEGLKAEDIMSGFSSFRNPRLTDVLQRLHYAEAHGTGLTKILEAYSNCAAKPKVEVTENVFKLILPNLSSTQTFSADQTPEDKLLKFALEHGSISRKQAEGVLGVSQTAAGVVLRRLAERGDLKRHGHSRNIKYFP